MIVKAGDFIGSDYAAFAWLARPIFAPSTIRAKTGAAIANLICVKDNTFTLMNIAFGDQRGVVP